MSGTVLLMCDIVLETTSWLSFLTCICLISSGLDRMLLTLVGTDRSLETFGYL